MPRETSPCIDGDFWLDKRRDGKSPEVWQIARYSDRSRSVIYRSTKCRCVEQAKAALHAHAQAERSRRPQSADDALVIPQLMLYWKEHGSETAKPGVIAGSLRAFIGFLMQDEVGAGASIAMLGPPAFQRFRKWRMKPHSFDVPWGNKDFPVQSDGVTGESVQRNLDDVRAALNHAAAAGRIPYAPKVPSVPTAMRSPARDVRVSLETLGAMVGFATAVTELPDGKTLPATDDFARWLMLQMATACRPEVAMLFNPRHQWRGDLIDLHPAGRARTKKRNPVVPAIEPFKPILAAWRGQNSEPVLSRRTAWRTMRRALGLPADVIPKTVRHTIATELRSMGVSGEQVSGLLGHRAMHRTTEVYAKYDPAHLREAKAALTTIFEAIQRHAASWSADHLRTKTGNGRVEVIARNSGKV